MRKLSQHHASDQGARQEHEQRCRMACLTNLSRLSTRMGNPPGAPCARSSWCLPRALRPPLVVSHRAAGSAGRTPRPGCAPTRKGRRTKDQSDPHRQVFGCKGCFAPSVDRVRSAKDKSDWPPLRFSNQRISDEDRALLNSVELLEAASTATLGPTCMASTATRALPGCWLSLGCPQTAERWKPGRP